MSVWHYDYNDASAMNKEFVAAYNAEFNAIPTSSRLAAMTACTHLRGAEEDRRQDRRRNLIAAAKGISWESPRGPFDRPETRDIVENLYIRQVEKVGEALRNVVFDKVEKVKDPGRRAKSDVPAQIRQSTAWSDRGARTRTRRPVRRLRLRDAAVPDVGRPVGDDGHDEFRQPGAGGFAMLGGYVTWR